MSTPPIQSTLPSDLRSCRAALRNVGLRATPARVAVLQLIRQVDRPLSHADVCDALGEVHWNRSTLWRNLCDLETAGLVQRRALGDRLYRFEQAQSDAAHSMDAHPHFICVSCGDVACLPEEMLMLSQPRGLPRSLRAGQAEVQVRGVCDRCDTNVASEPS